MLQMLEKVYEALSPNEIAMKHIDPAVLAKAMMHRSLPYSLALEVRDTIDTAKKERMVE